MRCLGMHAPAWICSGLGRPLCQCTPVSQQRGDEQYLGDWLQLLVAYSSNCWWCMSVYHRRQPIVLMYTCVAAARHCVQQICSKGCNATRTASHDCEHAVYHPAKLTLFEPHSKKVCATLATLSCIPPTRPGQAPHLIKQQHTALNTKTTTNSNTHHSST
jgi:hypothetical protein